MITKMELKGLLYVLNFYLLGGAAVGVMAATVAVNSGISLMARSDFGISLSARAVTAIVVILIGVVTSLLGFIVLIPAELKIIRRNLRPKLLAQRLSRKHQDDLLKRK